MNDRVTAHLAINGHVVSYPQGCACLIITVSSCVLGGRIVLRFPYYIYLLAPLLA